MPILFFILLVFPTLAFAQTYSTGNVKSLSTGDDVRTLNIYTTNQSGGRLSQEKDIYKTKGYDAAEISQSEGPVLYTRDASGDVYEVKASDCITYANHEPRADVSHTADDSVSLNPQNPAFDSLIDQQRIFLDIPISNFIDGDNFNIDLSDQARVNAGDVVVKDGKTFFNGQEIIPQAVVDCD